MINNTDASPRHDPAHPHRRDEGRQDYGDRPRKLVGQSAGRQARSRRPARRGCSMPAPNRHDDDAPRGPRPSRRQCHARAGRSAGHDGARDRDRRNGGEARASIRSNSGSSTIRRSFRTIRRARFERSADQERRRGGTPPQTRRSRSGSSLNACALARSASAGTSATRSRARSATALAGRHGRRRRLPQQSAHEIRRPRPARTARHRHGRDRHDRHRHRQLHHHRADRRRDDGCRRSTRSWCGLAIRPSPVSPARAGNGAATARPPASMPPA